MIIEKNDLLSIADYRIDNFEQTVTDIASSIYERTVESDKGISVDNLTSIVTEHTQDNFGMINCYPGVNSGVCHKAAFFISLTAKKHVGKRRKKGHLSFSDALIEIVRHMQGRCHRKTYHVIFITDTWNTDIYNGWKTNLEQIKNNATIEIYLIASGKCTSVNI